MPWFGDATVLIDIARVTESSVINLRLPYRQRGNSSVRDERRWHAGSHPCQHPGQLHCCVWVMCSLNAAAPQASPSQVRGLTTYLSVVRSKDILQNIRQNVFFTLCTGMLWSFMQLSFPLTPHHWLASWFGSVPWLLKTHTGFYQASLTTSCLCVRVLMHLCVEMFVYVCEWVLQCAMPWLKRWHDGMAVLTCVGSDWVRGWC